MAERRIDTTTVYSVGEYEKLPPTMEIEDPELHYAVDVEQHPELRPIIIVTNNEEKALPTAFLRRCERVS